MRGLKGWVSILAVSLFGLASMAYGHAIAVATKPARHEAVGGPDVAVNLRFNSRIDIKRSRLILMTPEGEQRALAIKETPAGDSMASEAKGLKRGSYVLRWQVLATDGHITRGEVPFSVK